MEEEENINDDLDMCPDPDLFLEKLKNGMFVQEIILTDESAEQFEELRSRHPDFEDEEILIGAQFHYYLNGMYEKIERLKKAHSEWLDELRVNLEKRNKNKLKS